MSESSGSVGAAFFDLDRTLLSGASGPILSEAMRQVGLLPDRRLGVESAIFKVFDLIGETWPSMFLTRQGARMSKGWALDQVHKAAEIAAEPLAENVLPNAHKLIDEHHEAGRTVVMATTTPIDLIAPLAERLGVDEVIATRYGRTDGAYDGTIDGPFVWGKGKARAVADWAARNDVDLSASFAYSDSYYDVPLLSMVGHPTAVNPDPRLLGVASVRRWPIVHFDVPAGIPKLLGIEPQKAFMVLAQPQLFPWVRFDIDGLDNIPDDGAAILVSNHRSYFDPLAIGYLISRKGRPVRFLGKKEVFDVPIVGSIATAIGGIRVDRGSGSDEPLRAADDALAMGEMVTIMPQGTIPRGPAFFDPELKGRWGAARLAHASGAPVIPIGLWGTERVWPRSSKTPDVTALLHPPHVRMRVGAAVELRGDDLDEDTSAIMAAIVEQLPHEARVHRIPTEHELERTYPSGRVPGDVDEAGEHEANRRPGTD